MLSGIDASRTFDSSIRRWHIDHVGLFSHQNLSAICTWYVTRTLFLDFQAMGSYSRINSKESLASRAVNIGESKLMSQVGRVHVDQCVSAVRAAEVPVFLFLRSSCNHDWGKEDCKVYATRTEICHVKRWGFCGCNPDIHQCSKRFSLCLITTGIFVFLVKNQ
jgi:hypothetical protein